MGNDDDGGGDGGDDGGDDYDGGDTMTLEETAQKSACSQGAT